MLVLQAPEVVNVNTIIIIQVLASNCSQQDVAEQASGVVEAVLQGRNSVVLAMGQPGKLLGDDPNDPEADSTSPGNLFAMHDDCKLLQYLYMSLASKAM